MRIQAQRLLERMCCACQGILPVTSKHHSMAQRRAHGKNHSHSKPYQQYCCKWYRANPL